jgi:hypothetical protein
MNVLGTILASASFATVSSAALFAFAAQEPAPPSPLVDPPKVPESPWFWMPNSASTFAGSIDFTFDLLVWISAVSLIGVAAAIIFFCTRYRAT